MKKRKIVLISAIILIVMSVILATVLAIKSYINNKSENSKNRNNKTATAKNVEKDNEINFSKKTTLYFDDATAYRGDVFTLPMYIKNNKGFYVGQVVIEYDANVLEFVSGGNGNVFFQGGVNGTDIEAGIAIFIFNENSLENTKKDGILANITFKVKEDAKKGNYAIKFSQFEKTEDGTYFLKIEDIDKEKWNVPKCKDGKIKIK